MLQAAWQRTPVRAVIGEEDYRWPEFVETAQRVGICASLSVPLLIGGQDDAQELVGSLNIYSQTGSASIPSTRNSCAYIPLLRDRRSATPAADSTPEKLSPNSRRHSSHVPTSTWPKVR
jgi:hypothetical protein